MPYSVCDARDLKMGHLGLIAEFTGTRPVLPIRSNDNLFLLMLPRRTAEQRLDFRIRRILPRAQKVLDLGPDFLFDYVFDDVILRDERIQQQVGSLIIDGQKSLIIGVLANEQTAYDGELCPIDIKAGAFGAVRSDQVCEIKSWRLLLPSGVPLDPPKLLASWPLQSSPT